jgi:AAA family ATP:ADP antiporter
VPGLGTDAPRPATPGLPTVVGLCGLAWAVMATYAVARPATESLFLADHGSKALPIAWIVVAVLTVGAVALYNRLSHGHRLADVFAGACLVAGASLALLLGLRGAGLPLSAYLLYAWKDIYIVLLVEIFWSFANSIFPVRSARWFYGLFCASGALGGLVGNLGVGALAGLIGTERAIWVVPIVLVVVAGVARVFGSTAPEARAGGHDGAGLVHGARVVGSSAYLGWLLVLIGVVQIAITLIDYQYNVFLEHAFAEVDARTEMISRVYAAIDVSSLCLQAATGLVLRLLGVPGTLLAIPAILGASLVGALVAPRFALFAIAKVASKALDYSLFRAAKEILYIPLGAEERTQGKAVVDMLGYRVAKGLVSAMLLGLAALELERGAAPLAFAFIVAWVAVTLKIVRGYRARVSRAEELGG